MKNSLVLAAVLLLFWSGCKKVDVGPPANGDPIFGLKGQLDGQLFEWQAGKDSLYMLATFDDSTANEPRFLADLGQLELPTKNGFPKIVIEFFGEGSTANWPFALQARTVEFAERSSTVIQKRILELQNTSFGNAPISSKWTVGGQTSSLFSPVFEFSDLNFSGQIGLETTDAMGRTTRQTGFLDLATNADYRVRLVSDLGILVAQSYSQDSSISFKWASGDTSSITFIDSTTLKYGVTANFSNGKTASAEIALDPNDIYGPFVAAADFSWQTYIRSDSTTIVGFQPLKILVKYIDDAGNEFRSDLAQQSPQNFFEILSVEDFERNEAGILTKKITVKFDCILADGKGSTKRMAGIEGTIAVGIPD